MSEKISIFSGNSSIPLSIEIAKYLGVSVSEARVGKFQDGETRVQILSNVRGKDVFVIQSTCPPVNDSLMELLIMIDALKRASAWRITAVIPYYGYGRQNTKQGNRKPITAKLVADLLTVSGPDRLLTLDLHAGQIQGFYSFPVDALKSDPVFLNYLRDQFDNKISKDDLVIIAPDAMCVKKASRIAKRLDCKMALIDEREEDELYIVGDIADNVVIIKDMIETGSSLLKASDYLASVGAKVIIVACTHAIFTEECIRRIDNSFISNVIITDSTKQSLNMELISKSKKITVLSIAPLIGEAIRRIHNEESVSSLFRYE